MSVAGNETSRGNPDKGTTVASVQEYFDSRLEPDVHLEEFTTSAGKRVLFVGKDIPKNGSEIAEQLLAAAEKVGKYELFKCLRIAKQIKANGDASSVLAGDMRHDKGKHHYHAINLRELPDGYTIAFDIGGEQSVQGVGDMLVLVAKGETEVRKLASTFYDWIEWKGTEGIL